MAERGFAAVVLPVGVGDEADRRVEGEIGWHAGKTLRVHRQVSLQPQNRIERNEACKAEGEHRHRVGEPALLLVRIDAGSEIKTALDRTEDR
ncbi:hypothetical protein D9M72_485910 [compost metagenome]